MSNVGQVMTRELCAVAPETNLDAAARLLTARHIGGAPVIDEDGRAIGVISLFDLVDPERHGGCVADVMSPFTLSIDAGATLLAASQLMLDENVHRLLVTDHGRLVGIVTTTDLLRGFVLAQA